MKATITKNKVTEEVNPRRKRGISFVRVQRAVPKRSDRIAEQRRWCRQVADEIIEIGSANDAERPGLGALLDHLKDAPKIDYVITRDWSRLSRNTLTCVRLQHEIERSGTEVVAGAEHDDGEPMSSATRLINAVVANVCQDFDLVPRHGTPGSAIVVVEPGDLTPAHERGGRL